ncbi:DUF4446 family protein [Paenibacillus sp. MSJ-34]|uniref:DUF4446 family protein n=1 Tax=Paenibacillus sp. MSJ-34 TaxID=2841529 RepID=UPI003460C242
MNELILEQMQWIVAGFVVILIVMLVLIIAQGVKLSKLRRSYHQMMENSGVPNLENVIISMKENIAEMQKGQSTLVSEMRGITERLLKMKAKIGIIRYNAFSDTGSDLSFSLAILNEKQDGIVLSALHSRDNSYVYAKPVQGGSSNYSLSPEEKTAISLAAEQE